MFIIRRRIAPALNAILITLGLLMLMFYLVHIEEPGLKEPAVVLIPPIHGPPKEEDVFIIKPPRPKPLDQAPKFPPIEPKFHVVDRDDSISLVSYKPEKTTKLRLPENTALVLKLGIAPIYPQAAAQKSIEGHVLVGFSVDKNGTVYDAHVIESQPKGIFDRTSLKAIAKFRYQPKKLNGKPIASHNHRYQFVYELDD